MSKNVELALMFNSLDEDDDMAGGGGFYVSTDKYDSIRFGLFPTAVRIPAGIGASSTHFSILK